MITYMQLRQNLHPEYLKWQTDMKELSLVEHELIKIPKEINMVGYGELGIQLEIDTR